jgi:hypothetical protein
LHDLGLHCCNILNASYKPSQVPTLALNFIRLSSEYDKRIAEKKLDVRQDLLHGFQNELP